MFRNRWKYDVYEPVQCGIIKFFLNNLRKRHHDSTLFGARFPPRKRHHNSTLFGARFPSRRSVSFRSQTMEGMMDTLGNGLEEWRRRAGSLVTEMTAKQCWARIFSSELRSQTSNTFTYDLLFRLVVHQKIIIIVIAVVIIIITWFNVLFTPEIYSKSRVSVEPIIYPGRVPKVHEL